MGDATTNPENNKKLKKGEHEKKKKNLLSEPGTTKVRKTSVNTKAERIKNKIKQVINELIPNIRITAKTSL